MTTLLAAETSVVQPAGPSELPRPAIPVWDVRSGGPVAHARMRRSALVALRNACLSIVPRPLARLAPALDRVSSCWLADTPSPYVGKIGAISDLAGVAGVWFINASYEWGCTARVDAAPSPFLRR